MNSAATVSDIPLTFSANPALAGTESKDNVNNKKPRSKRLSKSVKILREQSGRKSL